MKTDFELVANDPEGFQLTSGVRGADLIWPEILDSARSEISLGLFYVAFTENSPIRDTMAAIERAARRGVIVRTLIDESFSRHSDAGADRSYAFARDWLEDIPNSTVRETSVFNSRGGVHHAKYMVVDREVSWIGSHNFDWRSVSHIGEVGVCLKSLHISRRLALIFDADWTEAQAESVIPLPSDRTEPPLSGEDHDFCLTVSPRIQDKGPASDLGKILDLIGSAEETIDIQVRKIEGSEDDLIYWIELLKAFRLANDRGIRVRILVDAYVESRPARLRSLRTLVAASGGRARLSRVPELPTENIPYGRLMHSKLMIVDKAKLWIGSANWTATDFLLSRNIGLALRGREIAETASRRIFEPWWEAGEDFE